MRYQSFTISNYKGIDSLTIDMNKSKSDKVFTFVGLNESGKTSILEAINFTQEGYEEDDMHTLIPKKLKANFTGYVSVKTIIEVDEADNQIIRQYLKQKGYIEYNSIINFSVDKKCKYKNSEYQSAENLWNISLNVRKKGQRKLHSLHDSNIKEWKEVVGHIKANLMPRILYYKDFLFDVPERIYLSGTKSEDSDNKKYKDILQDILHSLYADNSLNDLIVNRLLNQNKANKDALDAVILQMSDKVTTNVFTNWGHLFKTTNGVIKLHPDIDENNDCYIEIKIQEGSQLYYISERSLGFRWFFAFLFFTLFRRNRKTDLGETLFLLDEPASNLHSTAQKKLLSTFEKFVEEKCKLIYTTHSHHLINPKWLNSAYIVKNSAVNYSDIESGFSMDTSITAIIYKQFASQHPEQQDYFRPILDVLDYQPGLLEKVPNIIITEGKNDYYTLRYINDVVLKWKYKKLNLLPGMGCGKNSQIIALYMAWGKDFIILLDGDKEGSKSKNEYIKEFGDFITPKILTYANFLEPVDNCMMEDIFTEEERISISKTFDTKLTKYKKSAFNSAIQNAFICGKTLPISKEVISKFEQILKGLNAYKFH